MGHYLGSTNRSEQIDQWRGYAILLVVLSHLQITILDNKLPRFLSQTWGGVDLFFVISGFLVSGSFAAWLEGASEHSILSKEKFVLARSYILRRFTRILPLAWLWSSIPVLLAYNFNNSGGLGDPKIVLHEMFAVWRFVYNYFTAQTGYGIMVQFWSLAVEEHYYLFLPCYMLLIPKIRFQVIGLLVLFISFFLIRIYAFTEQLNSVREFIYFTQYRVDGLILGSILGISAKYILPFRDKVKLQNPFFLKTIIIVAATIIWFMPGVITETDCILYGFSILAIASSVLVLLASFGIGLFSENNGMGKGLSLIGRRSYSIYLIHFPVVLIFYEIRFRIFDLKDGWPSHFHSVFAIILYLMALMFVSEICYRYIELPLIRLAQRSFSAPKGT